MRNDPHLAALAGLAEMTAPRLRWLRSLGDSAEVWERVRSRRLPDAPSRLRLGAITARWANEASRTDPHRVAEENLAAGVQWWPVEDPGLPDAVREQPDAPAVVFLRGDPDALHGPSVAMVGTRRCTRYGHDVAAELARDLSALGVSVVSGLALGIDGAAHRGALAEPGAPPVGVVANGLESAYPRRHADLWERVAERGVLVGECPVGVTPVAWRFPVRNRLIAALAPVVVVVESHSGGGSLVTVNEAIRRGRTVMAVPGSIRSPASSGTNRLLADGAAPCLGAEDVVCALGLLGIGPPESAARSAPAMEAAVVEPGDAGVLDALGWERLTLEALILASGRTPGSVAASVARLTRAGVIEARDGWIERIAGP